MSPNVDVQYKALPNANDEQDLENASPSIPPREITQYRSIIICAAVVVVNLVMVAFSMYVDHKLARDVVFDIAKLPTPDPYVGLPKGNTD
jgi:hypothetical protein